MAVTFVGTGAAAFGNNAAVTPALPTGLQSGDTMLLYAAIREDGASINTPSGWTPVGTKVIAGVEISSAVFTRKFVAGDAAPSVSFTGGGSNDTTGAQIHAWRGDLGAPVHKNTEATDLYYTQNTFVTTAADTVAAVFAARPDDLATDFSAVLQCVVAYSPVAMAEPQSGMSQSALGSDMAMAYRTGVTTVTTPGSGPDYFASAFNAFNPDVGHRSIIVLIPPLPAHTATGGAKVGGAAATDKLDAGSWVAAGGPKLGGAASAEAVLNPYAPQYIGRDHSLLTNQGTAPLATGPFYATTPANVAEGDLLVVEFVVSSSTLSIHAAATLTGSGWAILYDGAVSSSTKYHDRVVAWKIATAAEAVSGTQVCGVTIDPGAVTSYKLFYVIEAWRNYNPDDPIAWGGIYGPIANDDNKYLLNTSTPYPWSSQASHCYWDYSSYVYPTYTSCDPSLAWTLRGSGTFPDKLDQFTRTAQGPVTGGLSCTQTSQGIYYGTTTTAYFAVNGPEPPGGLKLGGEATYDVVAGSGGGDAVADGGLLIAGAAAAERVGVPPVGIFGVSAYWACPAGAVKATPKASVQVGGVAMPCSELSIRRSLDSATIMAALPGDRAVVAGQAISVNILGTLSSLTGIVYAVRRSAGVTYAYADMELQTPSGTTWTPVGTSYATQGRVRCAPDLLLAPGDTYRGAVITEVVTTIKATGDSFSEAVYGQG